MDLRERVVNGYVNAHLRKEKNMVMRLIRTGRLERDEWREIVEQFEELVSGYRDGEIDPDAFLEKRNALERELGRQREDGKNGVTRDEAIDMYENSRPGYEEAFQDACLKSGRSTLSYVAAIPVIKFRHFWSELKFS